MGSKRLDSLIDKCAMALLIGFVICYFALGELSERQRGSGVTDDHAD